MAQGQTFQDHIHELRRRLVWVIGAMLVTAFIAYGIREQMIRWLQEPLGQTLYYTSPMGSFNFVIKIAMVVGFFVALPVLIYHLIRFIEPALPRRISKKMIALAIFASFFLAICGILFGYYILVPLSLKFFNSYSTAEVKPWIAADQYLNYLINNLIVFALIFQLPLVALFINRITPLKPSMLLKYQRHVIVGAFAFTLILPFANDPLTDTIVAAPMIILFYLSVMLVAIDNARRNRKARKKAIEVVATVKVPEPKAEPEVIPVAAIDSEESTKQYVPVPKFLLPVIIPINDTIARTVDGFAISSNPQIELAPPRPFQAKPIESPDDINTLRIDGFLPPTPASA